MSTKYLTVEGFANRLGLSHNTVRQWIQTGKIAVDRIGPPGSKRKLIRIPATELDRCTEHNPAITR